MQRPTPAEIAEMISEDMPSASPVSGSGGVSQGTLPLPTIDVSTQDEEEENFGKPEEMPATAMRTCSAISCGHNVNGETCVLREIEVDERGGCAQYEPAEQEHDAADRRYKEDEVDVADMPAMKAGPAWHNPADTDGWTTGKWDPRGSAT